MKKCSISHVGPTQVGPTQVGPTQVGPTLVGPTQLSLHVSVHVLQVGPTQLSLHVSVHVLSHVISSYQWGNTKTLLHLFNLVLQYGPNVIFFLALHLGFKM